MNLYIFLKVAIFLQNISLELVKVILGKDSPLVRLEWFIICYNMLSLSVILNISFLRFLLHPTMTRSLYSSLTCLSF